VPLFFGCNDFLPGEVSCKVLLYVNGQPVYDDQGNQIGRVEKRGVYFNETFTPELTHYMLKPGDIVELYWQGDEYEGKVIRTGPVDPFWAIGQYGGQSTLANGLTLATDIQFTVTLLEEFPKGGRVKLNEWLPDLKQLDYLKSYMLLGGLTIQTDQYEPHLRLATGDKLLANIGRAKDWTAKRDSFARPGRLPERDLDYRFGEFGQLNKLLWLEDENVTKGYGNGTIEILDEVLAPEYEIATLPFAATETSPVLPGLLRILNFDTDDLGGKPVVYSSVEAKPRLTLREAEPSYKGMLITTPAVLESNGDIKTPAVLAEFTTSASYFDGVELSLVLARNVLTFYWQDLRAMLDESRHLVERYRLTPKDIAELDFSIPLWDNVLGDYFAVSSVGEYDSRRSVEVTLCRLNATHLGPPAIPDAPHEWFQDEYFTQEWY
jgi:hypothetical protein